MPRPHALPARMPLVLAASLVAGLATCVAKIVLPAQAAAATQTVCMLVVEAGDGTELLREGDCDIEVTPASTFKIALALMGYDAGILEDEVRPEWPFKKGYVDWRKAWRQAHHPRTWMRESVVWYSQVLTTKLGADRFRDYVEAFDYGNRDVSGTPGKDDGLTHAWLSSSLRISPQGQVRFLRRLLRGDLPVSSKARAMTAAITSYGSHGGWAVHGKTGAGFPVNDGRPERNRPYGWFVGWAERDGRSVIFARLIQDSERKGPPGFRARDWVLKDLFAKGPNW